MQDVLIYGVFTFSMLCMVAYFAIPFIKKMKEERKKRGEIPADSLGEEKEDTQKKENG